MKTVLIDAYGEPGRVARCVDQPDPIGPEPNEIVFDVLAFPINPADLLFCRGQYRHRLRPQLPATPGAECVGRIIAVGENVAHLSVGDLVINLERENWVSRRRIDANSVVKIRSDVDIAQASMLRINPPTALLMLTDLRELQPGDWVIQNVANSGVGRWVISLAAQLGLRTVNVVRRQSLFTELYSLGADVCVMDGAELAARVRAATDGAPISLGLDAVGGRATERLASCIADGGLVCHYGTMSGEEPVIGRGEYMLRGLSLTGFMLGRFLARRKIEDIAELYEGFSRMLGKSALSVPVRQIYPIESIGDALRHAQNGERGGKILVAPNGDIA